MRYRMIEKCYGTYAIERLEKPRGGTLSWRELYSSESKEVIENTWKFLCENKDETAVLKEVTLK